MRTTTFSSFSCLIILLGTIFCLIKASSLTSLPLLNAYASTDGTVKLHHDTYGYYAYVDFQYLESEGSDSDYISTNSSTGEMMIGLYTSQTWLSSYCLDFTTFDCSANSCTPYTYDTVTAYLPYFYASGYSASASAYLDYNGWSLSQYAAIATYCSSSGNYYYGEWRTGIIGMGVSGSATSNYRGSELFTIYLDPTTQDGELTFSLNQNRIADPSNVITLPANSNWEASLGSGYFCITNSTSITGYYVYIYYNTMIFDLDSPTIGLPSSIYNNFVSSFSQASGVSCSSDYIYPTCYYYGTMGNLPNITLYTQGQSISIPPQVYIENGFSYNNDTYLSTINLNIRALSSSLSGSNYVSYSYNNYIIMGSDFMTYYYTKFDNTLSGYPQISLYVSSAVMPGTNLLWLWILLGVSGFILIITCIVCCCKKAKMSQRGGKVAPTDQAPLITNNDGTNYQYNQAQPTYDAYTYGNYYQQQNYGYNYPQDGGIPYAQQPQGYNPYNPN